MFLYFLSQLLIESTPIPTPTPSSGFWDSPIWQSIGVIVSVIFGLISIYVSWKQFHKKSLSYTRILTDQIDPSIPRTSGMVEFMVFKNDGNVAITPEDFIEAIMIKVPKNSTILSAEVISQWPINLGVNIQLIGNNYGNYVKITPLLLNKQDSFKIKLCVLTDYNDFLLRTKSHLGIDLDDFFQIKGRIVDIKHIKGYLETSIQGQRKRRVKAAYF